MGSTSLLGFSCLDLRLVFLNLFLLFLGTCCIFFRECWNFPWVFLFYFVFCTLFWVSLTTEIRFFALKSKKRKVLNRGQNGL